MPEGQFSGPKSEYIYVLDNGGRIKIKLDPQLNVANSGLVAYDAENPGTLVAKPDRFKPRGVYWQGTASGFEGRRKFLVCGTVGSTLYTAQSSTVVTVDGAAGKTTGRRGEQQTF